MAENTNFIPIKKKGKLFFFLSLFIIIFIICSFFSYFFIFYNLPTPKSLKDYKTIPLSSHIYDRNGKLLYEVYLEQNRTPVKLKDLPAYIPEATIAIEDRDFYRHGGISIVSGILRAIKDTVLKKNLQGGSTITQQLVKSALLTPERTISRKLKEMILAIWTEKLYSKSEILELYLNQVPYGGSSYGIEEAAKNYFGKNAKELKLDEAALLAGLPQAPSLYSPYVSPDLAQERRNEVLKKMTEQGYITKDQEKEALSKKVEVIPPSTSIKAPHFVFYVKKELEDEYGVNRVEEGGLKVITTLDLNTQNEAEKIVREELEKVKNYDIGNGALLVTRPPTGEILAMVGSADYFATPSGAFNVTTALRQPGSSIKPLNYAVGLERKLVTLATVFLDLPTCFNNPGQAKSYCPVNYDGKFHGPVQLRYALANSFNIPAVKMMSINGVANFVASSSAFTIASFTDPQRYGLSLTLGGGEVKMTEMAQAYSSFANRGRPKKLSSILEVKDYTGKSLYKFEDPNYVKDIASPLRYPNSFAITSERAISEETAFLISNILSDNGARSQEFGTNSQLVISKHPGVSVKTGTTDDIKDNWTIGYTPNFLTAVWVGNNNNTPMNQYLTSGITGAAPIWNRVMTYVLKNQPDLKAIKPENVIAAHVCNLSGDIAGKNPDGSDNCPSRYEYFIKDTLPKKSILIKAIVPVNKDTDTLAKEGDPNVEMKEKTVIKDEFSTYCVDCAHPENKPETLNQ